MANTCEIGVQIEKKIKDQKSFILNEVNKNYETIEKKLSSYSDKTYELGIEISRMQVMLENIGGKLDNAIKTHDDVIKLKAEMRFITGVTGMVASIFGGVVVRLLS